MPFGDRFQPMAEPSVSRRVGSEGDGAVEVGDEDGGGEYGGVVVSVPPPAGELVEPPVEPLLPVGTVPALEPPVEPPIDRGDASPVSPATYCNAFVRFATSVGSEIGATVTVTQPGEEAGATAISPESE